jgi:hypothetical protein
VDNRLTIFTPRILLVHDQDGQLRLSHEELMHTMKRNAASATVRTRLSDTGGR